MDTTSTPADLFDTLLRSNLFAVAAAIALVIITVCVRRQTVRLPGSLKRAGTASLDADEVFGEAGAGRRLRDFAHVIEHGECRLLRVADARLRAVPPPPGHSDRGVPHLHRTGSEHERELHAHLHNALADDGFAASTGAEQTALERVHDMLSNVPALCVLREAGVPPTLRHHRWVVLHGAGVLRCLVTGYVASRPLGASAAADGSSGPAVDRSALVRGDAAWFRLTVVSPNLLVCGDCARSSCRVQYTVRDRGRGTIDDECAREAARWAAAYGRA